MQRFTSADPGFDVQPDAPQSWNLYAYVRNNPVGSTDPTGKCINAVDCMTDPLEIMARDALLYGSPEIRAARIKQDGLIGAGGIGLIVGWFAPNITSYATAALLNPKTQMAAYELLAAATDNPSLIRGVGPAASLADDAARGAGEALKDFSSVAIRTTRQGTQGVRLTRPDGSVLDITQRRVKEFVQNTHPNAPPGTLQRVKFPNAQPGSKGLKRDPTPDELRLLEEALK